MVAESDDMKMKISWDKLAGVVNDLSPDQRLTFRKNFRTFAHDLREACGQIQAAGQLLRRQPIQTEQAAEWLELLDVIHAANTRANVLLAALTNEFIEKIETGNG
jgi:hypothetical protein